MKASQWDNPITVIRESSSITSPVNKPFVFTSGLPEPVKVVLLRFQLF